MATPESLVTLEVPDAVVQGEDLPVRVVAPAPWRSGEVTLERTIAYRYRERAAGDATYLAAARRAEVLAGGPLPTHPGGAAPGLTETRLLLEVPEDGPATVDTELVSVEWAVRARLDLGPAGQVQDVRRVAVVTAPPGEERAIDDDGPLPGPADARGHTRLTIEGVRRRWLRPGQRLAGEVVLVPLHPGTYRSVRLELALRAYVPHGPRAEPDVPGKEVRLVVAAQDLASGLEVRDPWRRVRLAFEMTIPGHLPAPTLRTPEFELTWALRAVAYRPLHQPAYAELPLLVATATEPDRDSSVGSVPA